MRRLALVAAALIVLAAPQARAAQPGDACTGAQAKQFTWGSLYPNTGFENGMFCNGSTWSGVINFQSNGNVGIGTTSPASTLQIGSGQIEVPNGTTAAPSYSFTNFSSSGVSVASATGFLQLSGKNATATVGNGGLEVSGIFPALTLGGVKAMQNEDGNSFWLQVGGGFSQVTIPGNVGIGTTSPAAPLHVNGEAIVGMKALACSGTTAGAIRYNSSTFKVQFCSGSSWADIGAGEPVTPAGSNGQIQFNSNGTALGASSGLFWDDANKRLDFLNASRSVYLAYNSGSEALDIHTGYMSSYLAIYDWVGAPRISGSNMHIGSDDPSGLYLFTDNTERMMIDSTGNVGIGTTTPAAPLHVNGEAIVGMKALACAAGTSGAIRYNSGTKAVEFCNGAAWTQLYQVQSTPVETAPSGSGYFVLTAGTYNGNLGGYAAAGGNTGRAAADTICLSDLTANTGWQGYATANSRSLLNATHVHAFLCDGATCTNPMPLTTYYFANAGNAAAGGGSFTTDSGGIGPYDRADWAAANYFDGTYTYWANRDYQYNNAWLTTPPSQGSCTSWTSASSGDQSSAGTSAATDGTRWSGASYPTCDKTEPLICMVNP